MATQPPPRPDQADPIDPSVPGELPPVISPEELPNEPQGVPEVSPDFDQPDTGPAEIPEY
jgi:hypothetical protein